MLGLSKIGCKSCATPSDTFIRHRQCLKRPLDAQYDCAIYCFVQSYCLCRGNIERLCNVFLDCQKLENLLHNQGNIV